MTTKSSIKIEPPVRKTIETANGKVYRIIYEGKTYEHVLRHQARRQLAEFVHDWRRKVDQARLLEKQHQGEELKEQKENSSDLGLTPSSLEP